MQDGMAHLALRLSQKSVVVLHVFPVVSIEWGSRKLTGRGQEYEGGPGDIHKLSGETRILPTGLKASK